MTAPGSVDMEMTVTSCSPAKAGVQSVMKPPFALYLTGPRLTPGNEKGS